VPDFDRRCFSALDLRHASSLPDLVMPDGKNRISMGSVRRVIR
jgi:hypothetical protein